MKEEDAKKYFLINYSSKGKLLLFRRIKGTYQRISKSTNIHESKKMIRETRKMRKKMHDRASKLSRVEAVMIFLSFLSRFFLTSFHLPFWLFHSVSLFFFDTVANLARIGAIATLRIFLWRDCGIKKASDETFMATDVDLWMLVRSCQG